MVIEWKVSEGILSDAEIITKFQMDMAAESEGTVLDYPTVLRGVTHGLEDKSKGIYFVARGEGGEPIGSLFLTKEWSDWNDSWYWWIQSVYVVPEYRRKGVFTSLYSYVKQMSIQEGISCLRLYVDRENEKAQKCYQRQGMKESHYLLYED